MTNFVEEHRFGRFTIDRRVIHSEPTAAALVLSGLIVFRAEMMYHDFIEYLAFGPDFEPVALGASPPWYVAQIHDAGDGLVRVTWERDERK